MHTVLDSILAYVHGDGLVILPEMELLLFALGILIFDFLLDKKDKYWNAILALLGVSGSALGLYMQAQRYALERANPFGAPGFYGFHNTVVVDGFFLVFAAIFLAATALVVLLSVRYLDLEREQEGEYYALVLLSCIGMMFMASGTDLIVLFLGLETMALSFYVMTGFLRGNKRSNEAAMKYLLLGAFSTGILAYGFSLLYGVSASTNIEQIGSMLERRLRYTEAHGMIDWLVILAFVSVAAGLFFKVAAVPFHQWAPDVYEGAPTPVTAYVGQSRGADADEHQAAAGLFFDFPCWVHPARAGGGE
jgi:NADH-quinone oxidoreductase subunit N